MRNKLIFSLAGAAFSFAASGLAIAADIAVKAAAPSLAPVYNWTGWYVGGNVGASFGNVKTDFNASGVQTGIFQYTAGPIIQTFTAPVAGSGFDEAYPAGFIGGGQIGYNWQYSPLIVVGLEADFQGALEKDRSTPTFTVSGTKLSFPGGPEPKSATAAFDYTPKIEWFGTARLRAGYLFGDGTVLTYVTGGLAYGEVDVEGTSALSNPVNSSLVHSVTQAFGHSNVNTGWVVGTGTEGKLLIPGWTYKIEGLYMDLGHLDATGPGGSVSGSISVGVTTSSHVLTAEPVHTHSHFTDGILRAGLNYKFN